MIRIVSLVTGLALAAPAFAEALHCASDGDCPGTAVCIRGTCVAARRPTSPAPEPDPTPSFWVARSPTLKAHPLVPLALLLASSQLSRFYRQPVTMLGLPLEAEFAMASNVSLVAGVTPLYVTFGTGTGIGGILTGGFRIYPGGGSPDGFYAGAMLSLAGATIALPSGLGPPGVGFGFDTQVQAGYQWVFSSGLTIGVAGTWSPVLVLTSGGTSNGLGFQVPVGFTFH
jgi:hypothetical protein